MKSIILTQNHNDIVSCARYDFWIEDTSRVNCAMPRWPHVPNELQLQLQLQLQRFVYGTDILGIESNRPTRSLEPRTSRYCSVARSKTKQGLTLINDTDMIIRPRQLVIVWKSGGRAGFKPQAGASSLLARLTKRSKFVE